MKKARTIKRKFEIGNKQPFFFNIIKSVDIRIPIINIRKKRKLKYSYCKNSLLRIDDFIRRSWLRLAENRRLNVVNHRFWWKRQLPLVETRWIHETRERQNGRMNADSIIYLFIVFLPGKKKNNLCNKRFLHENTNRISKAVNLVWLLKCKFPHAENDNRTVFIFFFFF